MKKTYMKLFALAMMLMAATTASAQYTTELEDGMFKAWDSPDPGANEVTGEDADASDANFSLSNGMYQELGAGGTVWGHYNVYYLWYADLTGTQTITFTGTAGLQLRVLMNRPAPVEGGDSHGGTVVERTLTIGDDGTGVVDVSDLSYVHLNCVKLGWGSPSGKIRSIQLYGSVKGSGETPQPIGQLSAGFQNDVVCISLGNLTNLKELMGTNKRLVYPTDCVSVKVNGEAVSLVSVEGMEGNKLFAFIDEGYPEGEDDEVFVSFTNPGDAAFHLSFLEGRFEGQDVPSFTDMKAEYQDGLGEYYPIMAAIPELVSAVPEDGSFNLSATLNTFVLTFNANVNCDEVTATLDGTPLTVAPSTGLSKELTLTYSGGALSGECELVVSNIKPELDYLSTSGEVTLTYSFGPVVIDPNDQARELIPATAFAECAKGYIPEGFTVNFNGEERKSGTSYGQGPRMFDFDAGGDFTKGLYFREGYCEADAQQLEAGKKYVISFNTAMWKDSGKTMKFEIYDENETAVYEQTINNEPNVNGATTAVSGSTFTSIKFVPEEGGMYRLRWTADGFTEVLLANVVMKYVPSTVGVEWMLLVQDALTAAQTALDNKSDSRYEGSAATALSSLISQYSDMTQFTGPVSCQAAADALNEATQAFKDHCTYCDDYDAIIKKACDVVRQNEAPSGNPDNATKFVKTELFAQMKALLEKYNASSHWQNVSEDENTEEWQLVYDYDVLTDDGQLQSAISELTTPTETAVAMFTTGPSKCNMTGYGVITERLRLGVETLKALGVEETNSLIVEANAAMTDDDALADKLKNEIKRRLYNTLNDPENTLFAEVTDPATLEITTPTFDMTVFVKNPNIYRTTASFDFTSENIPGWTVPEGYSTPGFTTGWSTVGGDGIPADGMFQTYNAPYRVEQTITGLPAGVYTIRYGFGERESSDAAVAANAGNFYYAVVTGADSLITKEPTIIGQSYPVAATSSAFFEDVTVTDGKLTIGVNANDGSHTFFNEVVLEMTAPAAGFAYPKMEEVVEGDVNDDGTIDVADISAVISQMAGTASYEWADVNGDGSVDVADISKIISIMAQ